MCSLIKSSLAVSCLLLLCGCAAIKWPSQSRSPPTIVQCDAQLLLPCDPLIADDDPIVTASLEAQAGGQVAAPLELGSDSVAAALIADAENNGRTIACQISHAALARCLCALERGGVLAPAKGTKSICAAVRPATVLPAAPAAAKQPAAASTTASIATSACPMTWSIACR